MFEEFASGNRKAIHPNIRASVYAIALQNGGEKEYDVLLNEYRTTTDADERNTALRSLGRVKGTKLIDRALSLPLSDEVKGQDVYLPIAGLRNEAEGIEKLWTWMTENWEPIQKKCPPGLTMLGNLVQMCTAGFTKQEQLDEGQKYFGGRTTKGFDRALEQSSDAVRAKIRWLERDEKDVEGWLQGEGLLEQGGKL